MTAATESSSSSSSSSQLLLQCYNKGCGKQFSSAENKEDSCQYHPGVPVFHDALKGWSCCNKKSTDFSTFLSIPGCSKSFHSNEKPPEPEKSAAATTAAANSVNPVKVVEVVDLESRKQPELTPRPASVEPMIDLRRTVAPSLMTALEKLTESLQNIPLDDHSKENGIVPVGTPCKNASCQARYENEQSNEQKCIHHSGYPVFHEGMKYWSCCQRKTSDFDNFLNQAGCTEGTHVWLKKAANDSSTNENCRYDFHQHGGFAVVTVYSKNPVPDKTVIRANRVNLSISISFEGGTKSFSKELELYGVIHLEESVVNFFSTKVEIKLKKADPINWPKLEYFVINKNDN